MEPTANPVKYFNELLCMDMVLGTLLRIIVVIIVSSLSNLTKNNFGK
jgi:hypothetical protein